MAEQPDSMPPARFAIPAPETPSLPIDGDDRRFPVRRIYCVGRNFAEHAREMGAEVSHGPPVFFCKPADAIVAQGGDIIYPLATSNLHHEVELVVALGHGSDHPIDAEQAALCVFGYAVGIDLTRRDRQSEAKSGGLPWDVGKAFDQSAPVSSLTPASRWQPQNQAIWIDVNDQRRQSDHLGNMIHSVPAALAALSMLFVLRPGDLLFMGTPAGVGPLVAGDRFSAGIDGLAPLRGSILPR